MANFTVEWLSKSYYTTQESAEDVILQARTQVEDAAPHPKVHFEEFLNNELDKLAKESRNQYSPTSPNNSCGYASGSESEVGDDSEGEGAHQRRMRTKFTSEQISKLENTFSKHKYLGATQRRKIAEKLNLSETQVKTWFQNRRMKLKREVQDLRPDFPLSGPSALLLPPLLFQHPVPSGQLTAAFYAEARPLHGIPFPAQIPAQIPLHPHHSHSHPHHSHSHPVMLLPPRFY